MQERLQDDDGQTAVEYVLTLAIAGASVFAVALIVGPLNGILSDIVDTILGAL